MFANMKKAIAVKAKALGEWFDEAQEDLEETGREASRSAAFQTVDAGEELLRHARHPLHELALPPRCGGAVLGRMPWPPPWSLMSSASKYVCDALTSPAQQLTPPRALCRQPWTSWRRRSMARTRRRSRRP